MRALRSPAIKDRASVDRVRRKLSLNPRTPTSEATPMATDKTTKPNFPGADLRSRQPIAAARFQLRVRFLMRGSPGSAIAYLLRHRGPGFVRQCVLDYLAVLQHDLAVGLAGHFRVMRDQDQRRGRALVAAQ